MSDNGNNDDGIRDGRGEYLVQRDTLREFNAILQRDSTDTTYKYALLRALVEIAEQESHHVRPLEDDPEWVTFPLGLIVEKWLYYYYPFIDRGLPQRHGEVPRTDGGAGLAFRREFEKVSDYYRDNGGLTAFALDLAQRGIPETPAAAFRDLVSKLRSTITRYPMKHLGFSWYGDHYQVVKPDSAGGGRRLRAPLNREAIIAGLGEARLRRRYFETFRAVGGFATGAEAIFAQWARFTAAASARRPVTLAEATEALLTVPVDERNVRAAEQVYRNLVSQTGRIECVWSGKPITARGTFAVDHAIPFSLWGSNALWNLLPAATTINSQKSDRIPTPDLVAHRSDQIANYWQSLRADCTDLFESEFRVSLSGMNVNFASSAWTAAGIKSLQEKCDYLIKDRGFEPWTP